MGREARQPRLAAAEGGLAPPARRPPCTLRGAMLRRAGVAPAGTIAAGIRGRASRLAARKSASGTCQPLVRLGVAVS